MATFTFGDYPVRMQSDDIYIDELYSFFPGDDIELVSYDASTIVVQDPTTGATVELYGNFDFSSEQALLASVVTGASVRDPSNALVGEGSGFSFTFAQAINGTVTLPTVLAGADRITGGGAADLLRGFDGDDTLVGGGGKDTLEGSAGADFLDGGTGGDRLVGGVGSDLYRVDSSGDTVVEALNAGNDTVEAWVSHTLAENVERLVLLGTALNGTGNGLANTLTGNGRGNTLAGGGGKDVLRGGGGADTLRGGDGADSLAGGPGNDSLLGGGGTDRFDFTTALSATTNVDTLGDFVHGTDVIRLDNDVFTALAATNDAPLPAAAFYQKAGAAGGHDPSDRIVYDPASHTLLYDVDGSGPQAAVPFAELPGVPTLSAGDFFVLG
jgi:Ca2+-binding RTX toxin-like protein